MSGRTGKRPYISRLDYAGEAKGWRVRIHLLGGRTLRQDFYDGGHGGQAGALRAAEAWRNATRLKHAARLAHGLFRPADPKLYVGRSGLRGRALTCNVKLRGRWHKRSKYVGKSTRKIAAARPVLARLVQRNRSAMRREFVARVIARGGRP